MNFSFQKRRETEAHNRVQKESVLQCLSPLMDSDVSKLNLITNLSRPRFVLCFCMLTEGVGRFRLRWTSQCHHHTHAALFMTDKTKQTAVRLRNCSPSGLIFLSLSSSPQREVVSATRLAAIPPAFSIRTLPAQATEYAFAFIQIPQDVSAPSERARRLGDMCRSSKPPN